MSWLDDLKGTGNGGDPPAGDHTAQLARSAIIDTKNGTRIKLEWQSDDRAFYWDSWHGVEGAQARFARDLLHKLGLDLDAITDVGQLADDLAALEGTTYIVNVKHNGDFVNTYVVEKPAGVQTEIPAVAPAIPSAPRNAIFDDDIPF